MYLLGVSMELLSIRGIQCQREKKYEMGALEVVESCSVHPNGEKSLQEKASGEW